MNQISHDSLRETNVGLYEGIECDRRFPNDCPIVARVDGRAFHSFTKGLHVPFDANLRQCMTGTAEHLLLESNAHLAYTQSDEISLVWLPVAGETKRWFGGRVCKLTSQLAAQATSAFQSFVREKLPLEYSLKYPTFDAKVWSVPSVHDAVDAIIARHKDAVKNSVTAVANVYFSHRELHDKGTRERRAMLEACGHPWENFEYQVRYGVFFRRRKVFRKFSAEELSRLPPLHHARQNPDLVFERSELTSFTLSDLSSMSHDERVLALFGEAA